MEFILYTNTSEKNSINKSLTNQTVYTGYIKDESSIINPEFLIAAGDGLMYLYNYLHCPVFGRSYFIDDITVVRTGLWRVSCTVDVLASFKSSILNLKCIIDKQQSQFNSNQYLNDGSFVADSRVGLEILNFPKGFLRDANLILVTIGPGGGAPT